MIKILISVYIAAILLFAGFADAAGIDATDMAYSFDRVDSNPKVWLNVSDARFDSRKEILTLSGHVSSECLNTLQPELSFDSRQNTVLVSVTAQGDKCLDDSRNFYVIVIDVKAFFATHSLNKDSMVNFIVDNYVDGAYAFTYLAKQQSQYDFDTTMSGKIEIDHRTQKSYLVGRGSKIEILSRFDLHSFENRFVQIKGLIPNTFAIGEGAIPSASQLIVGQLVTLK